MKKILSLIICFYLIFTIFCVGVSAQSYGTIKGENVSVNRGETFTVKFSYENNPGFWIMFMTLHFDADSLEFVGAKKGNYKNISFNQMTYADDQGKVLFDIEGTQAKDVTGDAVLAEATFRVKDNAKIQNNAIVISVGDGKACNFNTQLVKPAVNYATVDVVCKQHEMENGTCKICGYEDGIKKDPVIIVPTPEKEEEKAEIQQTVTNTQNAGQQVVTGNVSQPQNDVPKQDEGKETDKEIGQTDNEIDKADKEKSDVDKETQPKINFYVLIGGLSVFLIAVIVIIICIIKKK